MIFLQQLLHVRALNKFERHADGDLLFQAKLHLGNKTCYCRPSVGSYNENERIYLYNSMARA